jgi:Mycothiol maleylpyruvate isomerase N-terminal domain
MSQEGMAGMQVAAQEILTIGETLDTAQWQLPSAASGWSVQDVVVHTGCLLGLLMAAVDGEVPPEIGIEALNDIQVAEKQGWNSAQALEALQQNLDKALTVFAPLQDEPLASVETQMLDLGSYPLQSIVDMFTFDLTTHLRYDILTPRGPIDRHLPPLGEAQLVPAVSWLLGGIPKMQPDLPDHISAPLALNLTGPAARQVVMSANGGAISVVPQPETDLVGVATMTSSTSDFLAWSTKRLPWEPLVSIDGDTDAARQFLTALNLV